MQNVLEFSGRLNPVPTGHLHKFLNILRDSTPTKKYQPTFLFVLSSGGKSLKDNLIIESVLKGNMNGQL